MNKLLCLAGSALLLASCKGSAPTSTVAAADRAQARTISDPSDLIGGPKASGAVGDFLLINTKVRFIVAAAGKSRAWFPTGGVLLDADRVRPAGQPGDDRFQEMVSRLGTMRMLYADAVVVGNDGSDGNDAVVRVTGHDVAVPILQSILHSPASNVTAVTEYRLAPYAESLEVTTTITDTTGAARNVLVGDVYVMADFLTLFAPGYGTNASTLMGAGPVRYFAGFGGSVSYAISAPGRTMQPLFPQAEIFALGTDHIELPANSSASFTRYFVVGTGDVAGMLPEIVRREGGDPSKLVTVSGAVSETTTSAAVVGAQVQFSNGSGPYAVAVSDGSGHFQAPLERAAYSYAAVAPDRTGPTQMVDVSTNTAPAPATIQLTDTGSFSLAIKDAAGGASPARVQIFSAKDGSSYGYFLSGDGTGEGILPPGDYRAVVSRGYEWEDAVVTFSVTAGKPTTVAATIARVVDTTGYVAIDSHTHTAISVDSQLDPHERVRHALADGVELVVTTDHDIAFDIAPTVAEMGFTGGFATAIGCEASPVPGHINGYPVTPTADADTNGYWEVKWWSEDASHDYIADLWPKDIFAALRDKLSAEVVQLNHPRSSQGVLNWVAYDATMGMASVDPTEFDTNWDVIEICNAGCDSDPQSENGQSTADLYSFLNQGLKKAGVGVSDNHGSGSFLGRARTMVEVHDDDPKTLDPSEVWMSLKAGRSVVLDGAFATATITDDSAALIGMGELAKATGSKITLHVKVQAPSWIPTDRIRVIANGVDIKDVGITPSATPPPVVRFDADIVLDGPSIDTWYMVIVDADGTMAPVIGSPPRTFTNPIFADRNGNGAFEAPGL